MLNKTKYATGKQGLSVSSVTPTKQVRKSQSIKFTSRNAVITKTKPKPKKNLFISVSFRIGGEPYLVSWATDLLNGGNLHGEKLTRTNILKLFKNAKNVFVYGVDLIILEKHFDIELRQNFKCINLLKVYRDALPCWYTSMKIEDLKTAFGIDTKADKTETNIWEVLQHWNNPKSRNNAIKEAKQSVEDLIRLQRIIFNKYNVNQKTLNQYLLK